MIFSVLNPSRIVGHQVCFQFSPFLKIPFLFSSHCVCVCGSVWGCPQRPKAANAPGARVPGGPFVCPLLTAASTFSLCVCFLAALN